MILSRYLRIVPHPERPGWSLVFSTRKGSLCVLPDKTLEALRRGEVAEALAERLTKLAVVVPDPEAEKAEVLGFVDEVNRVDPGVTLAVILGMACNFACPYCYEGDLKGGKLMTPETADALVAFAKGRYRGGKRQMRLDFYGGETLLYVDRIEQIAGALKPFVEGRGGTFGFSVVTNGSLLTPKLLERLNPLGLLSCRITLDGPPDLHDRTRPYASGKGSFADILANLKACAGRVKLAVAGNFTETNWRRFPELLDLLEAEGLGPGVLGLVHFCPVNQPGSQGGRAPEYRGGCASVNEPWLVDAALSLREEVLRRGFGLVKNTPTPCMIDLDDALTVDWDGTLFNCPALIGRPEFAAGDLGTGLGDYRETYKVGHWKDEPACRDCIDLPLCLGGCRTMRYEREGALNGVDCQRSFLDATLGPTVLQDLKYRHPGA